MKFYHSTLSNGLTLLGEKREGAVSTAVGVFTKTGARDEAPAESGISHFLEHMVFKGTTTRSSLDITYQLGSLGAQANAYTAEEVTVFYTAVLPEYYPRALEILCDMMSPALDAKEFDLEKKVILDEIALYLDRPTHVLFETALAEYFKGHSAGNKVLGTAQSVGAMTVDMMRSYHARRYKASNMIVAVTGDFDWSEFVDLAGGYTSAWPAGRADREVFRHEPSPGRLVIEKENLQQAHLCLVGAGPSAMDEERYALQVLAMVLGGGSGSKAYWDIVDKGLGDAASIDVEEMDGTGIVYGYLSTTPDKVESVGEILLKIMKAPLDFTDGELDRARVKLATQVVLEGESTMRRLMAVGLDWLYRGRYQPLDEEIERIKQVGREEIAKALDKYSFSPSNTVVLLPSGGQEGKS